MRQKLFRLFLALTILMAGILIGSQSDANSYTLSVGKPMGALIHVVGNENGSSDKVRLDVAPDSVGTFRVFIKMDPEKLLEKSTKLEFNLVNINTGVEIDPETVFYGPDK